MALLTGSLYAKKTLGRSLFGNLGLATEGVGETNDKREVEAKRVARDPEQAGIDEPEEQPEPILSASISESQMPGVDPNANASGGIKVTWRKSIVGKNKRPAKDFFTPKDETTDPEVEHEKRQQEVPSEAVEKKTKKRPVAGTQPILRSNKSTPKGPGAGVSAKAQSKPITKASRDVTVKEDPRKDDEDVKEKTDVLTTEETPTEIPETVDPPIESDYESAEEDHDDQPVRTQLETVVEEAPEDLSDDNSSESKSVKTDKTAESEESKKPIVIKVVKPSKYAEKLRALLAEEGQTPSLQVLQPDAIANLKRELARKGIIESYDDDDDFNEQPTADGSVTTECGPSATESDPSADKQEEQHDESGSKNDSVNNDDDDPTKEDDMVGDDKRDGYKTNKSFEIRRLQAKAEREREEKRSVFTTPKFFKGSKVAQLQDPGYQDHRKNWVRKKPKSILKLHTGDETKKRSKGRNDKRKSATVRIREPEYDYKLFSAGESDSSSDAPSQSSSVFGYRPNSATSLLTDSTVSFMDDASVDSVYYSQAMRDWEEDDAFYRASALDRTVHDLYDDIDRLNPSRLTNVRTPHTPQTYPDGGLASRVTSADQSYVDRSSLHAMKEIKSAQRPIRNTSAVREYDDKPLQLFDAMRYGGRRQSRPNGYIPNPAVPEHSIDIPMATPIEQDDGSRKMGGKTSRQSGSGLYSKRSARSLFPNGAIAFGPKLVPIPSQADARRGEISESEWVNRAQKFFATAYAGRRKQAEQRKRLKRPGFFRKLKKSKKKGPTKTEKEEIIMPAICYCQWWDRLRTFLRPIKLQTCTAGKLTSPNSSW